MKYRIFFDADEVLMDFMGEILKNYNEFYNKNLTIDDMKYWNMQDNITDGTDINQFMDAEGFFKRLKPFPNAAKVLQQLITEGHDVYISTAVWKEGIMDKYASFEEHFPFLDFSKIIMIKDKFILNGDFMIDDKIENVATSSVRYPVLMDKPWNKDYHGAKRVYSLEEFYEYVHEISEQETNKGVVITNG